MRAQVFEVVLEHNKRETISRRREVKLTSHIGSGGGTTAGSTRGVVKRINNQDSVCGC